MYYMFCYICRKCTLKNQRRNITTSVKKLYLAYFKVHLGGHDKCGSLHDVQKKSIETLRLWTQEKNVKLKFGMAMVGREQTNHFDNCYFRLVNVRGFNKKTKYLLKYTDTLFYHSTSCAIALCHCAIVIKYLC